MTVQDRYVKILEQRLANAIANAALADARAQATIEDLQAQIAALTPPKDA